MMAVTEILVAGQASRAKRRLLSSLTWLILPGICLLPILLYLPFLLEPFERDEGVYATIAQGLLRGELPYRDFFDHKPPLIYVWYAVSFLLFGESVMAPRLMAALAWSATTLLIYKQVALVDSNRNGLAAAAVFALSSGVVMLQANANTEAFMLLPATLCLFAATKGTSTPGSGWFFLMGLAGGAAIMTKAVALPCVAVLVVAIVVDGRKVSWTESCRRAAIAAAGLASVTSITILPFLLTGSWGDFLYANWTFNRLYSADLELAERLLAEVHGLVVFGFAGGALAVLAAIGAWRQRTSLQRTRFWMMLAWLCAAYGGVLISGRAYPHYYVGLLPGLALFAGPGLLSLTTGKLSNKLLLPIVAVSLLISLAMNGSVYLKATPEERHLAKYAGIEPALQNASPELAAFVASITSPDDEIYNLGHEAQLYFYARRAPATRFFYNAPFGLDAATLTETISALERDPPAVIIDSSMATARTPEIEEQRAQLQPLLDQRYDYIGHVLYADLYRLRTPP